MRPLFLLLALCAMQALAADDLDKSTLVTHLEKLAKAGESFTDKQTGFSVKLTLQHTAKKEIEPLILGINRKGKIACGIGPRAEFLTLKGLARRIQSYTRAARAGKVEPIGVLYLESNSNPATVRDALRRMGMHEFGAVQLKIVPPAGWRSHFPDPAAKRLHPNSRPPQRPPVRRK